MIMSDLRLFGRRLSDLNLFTLFPVSFPMFPLNSARNFYLLAAFSGASKNPGHVFVGREVVLLLLPDFRMS